MYPAQFASNDRIFAEHLRCEEKNDMKVQHYHDAYEIYYQAAGERTLILNGMRYRLKEGDLYVLRPLELHYTESGGAPCYERYLLNLPVGQMKAVLSGTETDLLFEKLDSCVLHLEEKAKSRILGQFRQIIRLSEKAGFLAEKTLCAAVLLLLMEVREEAGKRDGQSITKGERIPEEMEAAIRYIHARCAEKITLEETAGMVHMSRYHFCRKFHEATGATFLEYLYNVRLAKTHRLLLETDLSPGEIAARCGFSSTAHLTRVFRKKYQMAPGQFRKSRKNGDSHGSF